MKRPVVVGHSTVSACLLVENIQEELQFLKSVFGAQVEQPGAGQQGTVWQVEVRLGNSVVMIGRANKDSTPAAGMLYVWLDDVDATYGRAVEQGAVLISAPMDQPTGIREAGFKDPQGNVWWIGRRARRPSNAEVERRLLEQKTARI